MCSNTENETSKFSLSNKTALVTGASQGIGRAIALALAGAGADVLLASRDQNKLKSVATDIEDLGRNAVVIQADFAHEEQIEQLFIKAAQETERLDILVNNVGVNPSRRPFENSLEEEWELIINVNLIGTMRCLIAFGNHFAQQKGGSVINITSIASIRGAPTLGAYAATKGALHSLTMTLALEWANREIRVNAIAPGYVKTELTRKVWSKPEKYEDVLKKIPMGRFAQPEEIAPAAVFLASDAASYITGTTLILDGGWTAQ